MYSRKRLQDRHFRRMRPETCARSRAVAAPNKPLPPQELHENVHPCLRSADAVEEPGRRRALSPEADPPGLGAQEVDPDFQGEALERSVEPLRPLHAEDGRRVA